MKSIQDQSTSTNKLKNPPQAQVQMTAEGFAIKVTAFKEDYS
jgi:hypothetical protein